MRVRDIRLGILHYAVILVIFAYVGLYVLWWKQGYYQSATAVGEVAAKVKGDAYSHDESTGKLIPWSSEDLVQPSSERSAAFLATNVISTNNQTRGYCPIPTANCTASANCTLDLPLDPGICLGGLCMSYQWCPAENISLAGVVGTPTTNADIFGVERLTIWMKATMSFPSLDPLRNYSTVNTNTPISDPNDENRNLFSLGDLLAMTGTTYADIQERGCILLVTLSWECFLNSQTVCSPRVTAARLDNPRVSSGFNFRMPSYYRDDTGELHRDLWKYTGVRIFFVSSGVGYIFSVPTMVLQLSSGLAMMTIASVVTDFVMEYIMPQRFRYRKYKFMDVRFRFGCPRFPFGLKLVH